MVLVLAGLCGGAVLAQQAPPPGMWEPPVYKPERRTVERPVRAERDVALPTVPQPEEAAPVVRVSSPPPTYQVGAGDRLKISVYNAEKLSGEYPVSGDGKIAFPMLGRVTVGGMTLDQVTAELGRQLGDGYLLNPSVTVDIAAYRAVYILGEVAKPGQYPYTEGMTIYQLAAQAGGFTYRANRKKISLRHDNEQNDRKVAITNGTAVAPGDTVVIHQRFF
jgi:polysaccharide export outer membrane protein